MQSATAMSSLWQARVQSVHMCIADGLKSQTIQISMDGKGREIDNMFIEHLWRSVKYEYVYRSPASDVRQLYTGLQQYFQYYNHRRPHQGIGRIAPVESAPTQEEAHVSTNGLNWQSI